MGARAIEPFSLAAFSLLLLIPVAVFLFLRIPRIRAMAIAFIRMVVQLVLVGLYLETIFRLNRPLINLAWILVMVAVACAAVTNQSGLRLKHFFFPLGAACLLSLAVVFGAFFAVLEPGKVFSARYLIPLGGMILGNILRSNVICLDRYFHGLRKRPEEFITHLSLGATHWEARKPFMAESLKAAVSPQIATVATMGLVSLPGMMTGQILGGNSPSVAIQYQILIMVAIFTTATLSAFLGMAFASRNAFDSFQRLRRGLFRI
ncbi:MAG: ABC transporter permease [Acidobacteriota bacterium]|jgi:putative ABC transport system permease protein|nr:ABC transporter permease [Acidobacteriota bacterium]